jgi:GT2 family glycosyltransferase
MTQQLDMPNVADSTDKPKVAIIILNWNGWKDTVECLESLYQMDYRRFEIILVDNGSKDDSVQRIKSYAAGKLGIESKFLKYNQTNKPLKLINPPVKLLSPFSGELILIQNKENLGFARGVNVAMQLALRQQADYVLLLNNDIVVARNFISEMVKETQRDPRIGIAGPTIYCYDRPTTVDFAGENLSLWRVKGKEFLIKTRKSREVDKIEGSCMLIRREVLDKVGLLYPKYWAYWEETDLCFRAKKAGYRVTYIPQAEIWHKVAQSIGGENNLKRQYYLYRNRLLFAKRNLNWGNQAKFLLYFFGFELWLKITVELKHHTIKGAFTYLRAGFDGLLLFLNPTNR